MGHLKNLVYSGPNVSTKNELWQMNIVPAGIIKNQNFHTLVLKENLNLKGVKVNSV